MFTSKIIFKIFLSVVLVLSCQSYVVHRRNRELKMVHVIMRHGIRTPVSTYPKDPYLNYKYYPVGLGQLTNKGKLDLFNFGKFLRDRYDKFLGPIYSPLEYYTQSTAVDRTLVTVQLVNAGLWPPATLQKWGPLDWLPIPEYSQPQPIDNLLLVNVPCPGWNLEYERVFNSTPIQNKLMKLKFLLQYIEKATGQSMKKFADIQDVYTTLQAEEAFGLELPKWTKGYFPERMEPPSAFQFKLNNYNSKLVRLKGGVLLKKIIDDWFGKIQGTIQPKERKAFLYGGHDSTIANLLSALKVFDPQVPSFGIAILLELSRDGRSNEYGVEIFLKNSTDRPPHQLQIPGCEKFCTFSQLVTLTAENIPGNWTKECIPDDPDYVPPPTGGP